MKNEKTSKSWRFLPEVHEENSNVIESPVHVPPSGFAFLVVPQVGLHPARQHRQSRNRVESVQPQRRERHKRLTDLLEWLEPKVAVQHGRRH